ncbi:MAG: zinc-ribbon domain-containing protein [Chloroflexi bacterium]|nr:zinc-ribbon domain-containing protein [Chloroflexota bacterium]
MIYCPTCGTANRDGSKFCNECGTHLTPADAGVHCSQCGAFNSRKSAFCRQCGLRLAPPAEPEAGAPAAQEPQPAPEEPAAGLPSWLEPRHGQAVEDQGQPLPHWMHELGEAAPSGEPAPAEAAEPTEAESDWLRELRAHLPDEPAPAEAAETPAEEETVPDWLRQLRAGLPTLDEEEASAVPSWLGSESASGSSTPVFTEPPGAARTEGGQASVPVFAEEPEAEAPAPTSFQIPPWLEGLEPGAPVAAASEPDRPEGLRLDLSEAPAPLPLMGQAQPLEPAAPPTPEEAAEPAEIPQWIAEMKPQEETGGLLAGIAGVLPAAEAVSQPPPRPLGPSGVAPAVGEAEAALFRKLAEEGPLGGDAPRPVAQRKRRFWGRGLLALLLLAALGIPIVWGQPLLALPPHVPDGVEALYQAVERLAPGDAVLVGWDFDPSSEGEMGPLAEAVLGHVMERGARIVVVSQLPSGPQLANGALARLAAAQGNYPYGSSYLNLGYLPGNEAGLRALSGAGGLGIVPADFVEGQALAQFPAVQGLEGVGTFRLVIAFSAEAEGLRRWVEQVGSAHGVPLAAGVGAGALPAVQPYYQTAPRQLAGLAGGLPGAAAYESLRGAPGRGQARSDSLAAGTLVMVSVILLGNAAGLSGHGRG